jgi:autotransporter family porin
MSKALNWMFLGATARETVSRSLRSRLAATTILAVVPFLGYGRQAYAICDTTNAPDIECTGEITGANLSYDNANVTTKAPFSVTTDGLYIDGFGDIRFTDNNASSITNTRYGGTGLHVESDGADGDTPGAVTIITNGDISGTGNGIAAYNRDFGGSGNLAITVTGTVTGRDVDEEELDDDIGNDGIHAENYGNALTITAGAGSTVSGEHNAVDARNYGYGDLTINADGALTGNEYDAVFARNYGRDLKITVGAQSVIDGAGSGINAQNLGEDGHNLEIVVDGHVTGRGYDGIRARNAKYIKYYGEDPEGNPYERPYYGSGVDLKITTGAQSVIFGDDNGIDARNYGTGVLDIKADGYVTGNSNDGIYARTEAHNYEEGAVTDLTITTGAQSVVRGGGHGIGAQNYGNGDLTIDANGWVAGYSEDGGDGINAYNYEDSDALTITTGANSTVRGNDDGIQAENRSYDEDDGGLKITVEGVVTGQNGSGINAINGQSARYDEDTEDYTALSITTGANSVVTGAGYGIAATNRGRGKFTIVADGKVTGRYADGINAENHEDGLEMTITTGSGSAVAGFGGDGIDAEQDGYGNLIITVNGTVTGTAPDNDVLAFNAPDNEAFGINAKNNGYLDSDNNDFNDSQLRITVGGDGLVQGKTAGIRANAINGNSIYVTNYGVVRNLSGDSADRAIVTLHGDTHVVNNGDLIGSIHFGVPDGDEDPFGGKDSLDNHGVWNLADSESDFGENNGPFGDRLGNTGTILAADDPTTSEHSSIFGLESFENEGGLISLVDGKEGDVLEISATEGTDGTVYTGTNGHLAVDAALKAGGPDDHLSDEFIIHGTTAEGTTSIHVNVASAAGANLDGIPVVRIEEGDLGPGQFALDGPVNGGFFTWGLRLDDGGENWYELYTLTDANGNAIPGAGTYEFAAAITASQDIWLQTANSVLQRQADLRSLLSNVGVTPVADYSEPVEPTPLAPSITPGFWYTAFGAYVERDDEQNGVSIDRTQTTYGGMAGFDFGTQGVGDAWLFGVFGGYLASELEFKTTNSDWNYEGPTVGAYATYLNQALFVDATVKADFLDIDIDPDDLAVGENDADTDGLNVGGRIDTGYKFGHTVYIEPQATLAVVYTDIDDVDIFGGTVEFEDQTSVRGRLGLRVGVDHTQLDDTIYSADVTASVWEDFSSDSEVNIVDTGLPDFGASDSPSSTYGDVALGLSAASPDGWSAFVRGNYLFAEDYEAVAGSAGVRIIW